MCGNQEPNSGNRIVKIGEQFSVTALVRDLFDESDIADELLAFGFNVFSSINIELIGREINPIFQDDSEILGLTAAGSSFPVIAYEPEFQPLVLATLHFKALSDGAGIISIVTDLKDLNQGLIFLNRASMEFTIEQGITAVPLPPAVFLFLNGLLIIGWQRLRLFKNQKNN
ncbi:hypothetical protein GO003_014375 [Methylicorpusculum oleiharenae]|uniref:hypothetical protein n=1 Tax=Methylicorpusculum oleiharenae TaxID=1338687 RepID=UPI00135B0234|nr:hypothetical protein [Methylicorpusculum oleiharenae]MCD2451577.1 hypothetical protein [Methylicorpusculum oleiharenae]